MSLTQEQIEMRRTGIGGSDVAAIMGISPYSSPLDIWRSKVEGWNSPDNIHKRMGRILEPVIAQLYAEDTGAELSEVGTLRHSAHEIVLATPDRIAKKEGAEYLLEIKTTSAYRRQDWGESGTDEIPQQYLIQVAWTMAVADLPKAEVAVLIGGNDYRVYRVQRDLELEGYLIEAAEKWWRDHVVTRTPPPVDGSKACAEWLAEKYPRDLAPMLQATTEADFLLMALRNNEANVAEAEKRLDTVRNRIRALIGEAMGIEGPAGRVTWKKSKDSERVNWEAVARAAGASDDLIKQHTTIKSGPRVLRTAWRKDA